MMNLFIILFALCGALISIYLLIKKVKNEKPICVVGEECQIVISSKYSTILGIPNTLIGIAYYLLIFLWAMSYMVYEIKIFPGAFVAIAGLAFLYSVYLTYVQFFVLKKICGLCLIANFLNALILLAIFP